MIYIRTIPHKWQRYDTCGDYTEDSGKNIIFSISEMGDWKYEMLVAVHEFVEYVLIKAKGMPLKKIDDFDMKYEKKRKKGDKSEPGNDPRAPYYAEHQIATIIERFLAVVLLVSWKKYEQKIDSLVWKK